MALFSVIVPVYNRIDEVHDLLESLTQQTYNDFEIILVEDGSTMPCENEAKIYQDKGLNVKYYYKDNEGRSIARNFGIERSSGQWLIFFDSDCVIPQDYFKTVQAYLESHKDIDCFGGPDAAHDSFSDTQKAINYTMTSFLTTGGIRGGKVHLEKFVPRTFNMGFRKTVYDKVGGFREMFSEDIDMSTRIRQAGFNICLIHDAAVWHKRRIDFKKFMRQVYVFGMSRITLRLLYPDSLKLVHALPALAVITGVTLILLGVLCSWLWLLPIILYFIALFIGALYATRSVKIASQAIPAAVIQLGGYGIGFIKAYITKIIFKQGRNLEEEIQIRKGK
jgi:glycosyltransferase involved in cell wall biosynthesis